METGIEIAIENLKAQYREFKMKLSEKRKAGYDTLIAELHAVSIPSKIHMAEVTSELGDVQKALAELKHAEHELSESALKEVEDTPETDKEEEEIEVSGNPSAMEKARSLLKEANAALEQRNRERASLIYVQLQEIYKYLPADGKKELYESIVGIHRKLQSLRS